MPVLPFPGKGPAGRHVQRHTYGKPYEATAHVPLFFAQTLFRFRSAMACLYNSRKLKQFVTADGNIYLL